MINIKYRDMISTFYVVTKFSAPLAAAFVLQCGITFCRPLIDAEIQRNANNDDFKFDLSLKVVRKK